MVALFSLVTPCVYREYSWNSIDSLGKTKTRLVVRGLVLVLALELIAV